MRVLAIAIIASLLTACTPMEGDGFFNSGKPAKPAKCVTIREGFVKCQTI